MLGVSRVTVSHILSGRGDSRYCKETREKVLKAAQKLGYRPNRAAQIMRKGRSNLIGIIHFGTLYQSAKEAVHYLPQAITAHGYDIFVVDLSWHGECHRRAIDQLVDMRVEGVIILLQAESFGAEEIKILAQAGIPAVTLAGNEKLSIPSIYGDCSVALEEMVRHLHALGHKNLLLLANDYESRPTLERIRGFQTGIRQFPDIHGEVVRLPADRGIFDSGSSAYQYTKGLIAGSTLPDVILCSNDQWARGVFAAALEAGLRIPDDIAVTGFDNEPFGAQAPYFLTTVAYDKVGECNKAVKVLMDLITGQPQTQQHHIFPCKIVIRHSCGTAAQISSQSIT